MGRLPALSLILLAACEESASKPAPLPGRFDAVAAKADAAPKTDFCDLRKAAGEASLFVYPTLVEPAPPASAGWRWINLWATWCGPCVNEMPMIDRFGQRLKTAGKNVELIYLSVDEDAEAVDGYRKSKKLGLGPRVGKLDLLAKWLPSIGLDSSTTIPINVFVDPEGKVRCVRTGALEEHHYSEVERLVTQ